MRKLFNVICAVITVGLLCLGFFRFPNALGRLAEGGRDFGISGAYAFCDWFKIEAEIPITVNDYPDYSFLNVKECLYSFLENPPATSETLPSTTLPAEWETFKANWDMYWERFINKENLILYGYYLLYLLTLITPFVMFLIPIIVGVKKLLNTFYFRQNPTPETDEERAEETRQIVESKPLQLWHKFYFKVLLKIGLWFLALFNHIRERKGLWRFWLLLALLYFNVLAIFFEFCAYYVYFSVSFDFINLYRQVYKLCLDLYPLFTSISNVAWLVILILIFRKCARDYAWRELERSRLLMEEFVENELSEGE